MKDKIKLVDVQYTSAKRLNLNNNYLKFDNSLAGPDMWRRFCFWYLSWRLLLQFTVLTNSFNTGHQILNLELWYYSLSIGVGPKDYGAKRASIAQAHLFKTKTQDIVYGGGERKIKFP